jgi:ankyrin repeat protein
LFQQEQQQSQVVEGALPNDKNNSTSRMAAAVAEGARPVFTYEDAKGMLSAGCSFEAVRERMQTSQLNAERDGELVYYEAWRPEHKPVRAWLRTAAVPWTDPLGVFFDACSEGDEEYVSRVSSEDPALLDKGSDYDEISVIHAVCQGGLMRFVPDLVSRFGDVDVKDQNGQTPLYWACRGGQIAVFEYLVSMGADTKALSGSDSTVLHAACEGGNLAIVRALLDMGLDVNAQDQHSKTPLLKACQWADADVVSMLVERGANVNAQGQAGTTPLQFASHRGNQEMVQFLHQHGAALEGSGSFSPLCAALGQGHMTVAQYLVRVGASIKNVQKHDRDLVHWSCTFDRVLVLKFLLDKGIVSVTEELVDRCVREGCQVLRYVLLREESAAFVSHMDVSRLPAGFLGGYASVSKWREHELRMDLRFDLLSWRRGFVVSRLDTG